MTGHRARGLCRRFCTDEGGAVTIEFMIVFPMIVYFVLALGEIGTLMVRQVMLERGVDIAVRDIRLGKPDLTYASVKAKICETSYLLGACEDVLRLELVPLDDGASFPGGPYSCVDRSLEIQPVDDFTPGAREQIVVVRACLLADPVFPGSATAAMLPRHDAQGGHAIVVTSAFMNEPG